MKQYIDKAAVVAEIKKKLDKHSKLQSFNYGAVKDLESLLNFLDTLEVKEVDLQDSVRGTIEYPFIGHDFPNIYPNYRELKDYCDKNGIKDEDKVKIIIIKEK